MVFSPVNGIFSNAIVFAISNMSILSMSGIPLMMQIDNLNGYDQNLISFKVKKALRIEKMEKPKSLKFRFINQSWIHPGALITVCIVTDLCHWRRCLSLYGSHSVTNHAKSKFWEELIKCTYRYIEKVTGNDVLLITINASFFCVCDRGATNPKYRESSKIDKSTFQTQTLIGLKLWLSSLSIVADLFFCLLYSFAI